MSIESSLGLAGSIDSTDGRSLLLAIEIQAVTARTKDVRSLNNWRLVMISAPIKNV
jgi:hypothetical protein